MIELKGTPVSGDHVLLEDSEAGNAKKRATVGSLSSGSASSIHAQLLTFQSNVGTTSDRFLPFYGSLTQQSVNTPGANYVTFRHAYDFTTGRLAMKLADDTTSMTVSLYKNGTSVWSATVTGLSSNDMWLQLDTGGLSFASGDRLSLKISHTDPPADVYGSLTLFIDTESTQAATDGTES